MSNVLVIVESPTKAKTIAQFLGKNYKVTSSYGHIRDLPNSASEIPAAIKKEKWSRLGINVDHNFEPLYIIPSEKKKRVQELKELLKDASEILLATDEDREGESISWHLLEVLKPKIPVKRLVFHEITKEAIQHSLETTRQIDENLVRAQETRRTIDRLYGYEVSPLLWKKVAPKLSAGRVQSVATRLLVERERERIAFRSAEYWDLKAIFKKANSTGKIEEFEAELIQLGAKRIAIGKDFDSKTGKLATADVVLLDAKAAEDLKNSLLGKAVKVTNVESKAFTSKPYAPFTTSTLQQEGSRKLRFSAKKTMAVAQTLYENGFITYMRTDSTNLSEQAIDGARSLIAREFGKEYLPDAPRIYRTQVKNAQEAHEAIRPAGADFIHPEDVKKRLGSEAHSLYELIWKRMLACQMKDSQGTRVVAQIECEDARFRASGKVIDFPGFLRAYVEGSDDPDAELAEQEKVLPKLEQGDPLDYVKLDALSHKTQAPARYTEGSLIKELERLGIGRPSTWATVVDVVLSRAYAYKRGTALVPSFLATALTSLMERYFTKLVDYSFTASMEDDLDAISRGELDNIVYLKKFYHGNGIPGLKDLVKQGEETIDPREVCGIEIGMSDDKKIEVRIGKYGAFLSDGTIRASLPEDSAPDEMKIEKALEILANAEKGPQSLGEDSETSKKVYLKTGRFGPYVQLGDQEEGIKPKMASLLPGMDPASVDLQTALALLSLPKTLGKHPELGEDIVSANGRFGPYIKCGTDTRSIPMDQMSPITITFDQAIELLKTPKTRGRSAAKPSALKVLGAHTTSGKELTIKSGRYGPYVTDGEINASVPRGRDYNTLTIEDAVLLLEARALKIAEEGPTKKKKTTRKKAKS